ncbi:MAG: sugar ABC transporter substrate-binding protein, partial [Paracoccus sp. (in: a-proteobacteria)]
MSHHWTTGASALAMALAATTAFAQDNTFWAEAAAGMEGVTLRGVTESTPPSNYVRNVLAPKFE